MDIAPLDPAVDPVAEARAIVKELKKYDPGLHAKPRWLVLNKIDLLPDDQREQAVAEFVRRFRWKGPVFAIAAVSGEGCRPLTFAIMEHLEGAR